MPLMFEQQPKESAKAFAAFALYLNMGSERSAAAVAAQLAKSEQLIRRWSARWRWTDRVAAHGAHFAAVERQAMEAIARGKSVEWAAREQAQREEEWASRAEALELAREAIARWKKNAGRCGSLEGIARLLELASILGRRATGMATDKTELTGEDGGPIRIELSAALNKIYGDVVDVEVTPVPAAELPEGGN